MVEPPADLPDLQSKRLLLRKLTGADAIAINQYASDDDVTRFLLWDTHKSMEDTFSFLARVLQSYDDGVPGIWGIEYKLEHTIIGTLGFHHWRSNSAAVEIGYVIGKSYWGQGIVTEAVRIVLRHFFNTLKMNRVEAMCEIRHFASERVMQKVGMKLEGVLKQAVQKQDTYFDMKLYSILRDEWLQMKAPPHE